MSCNDTQEETTQERMMTTITIDGAIYAQQDIRFDKEPRFDFYSYDVSKYREGIVHVCPHTLTFDVPEDFDIRPGMIESLKAEKAKILAEAQVKANAIDELISKLLALPNHG